MKILSLNFLTCAVKACKSSPASYPLHPKDAELVTDDVDVNRDMLVNVLPRLDWAALRTTASEVCTPLLSNDRPDFLLPSLSPSPILIRLTAPL